MVAVSFILLAATMLYVSLVPVHCNPAFTKHPPSVCHWLLVRLP